MRNLNPETEQKIPQDTQKNIGDMLTLKNPFLRNMDTTGSSE